MSDGFQEMVKRAPVKHRMTRRLNDWDYYQRAIYAVTLTLEDRTFPWLGELIIPPAQKPEADVCHAAKVVCSPYGDAVLMAVRELNNCYPQVEVLEVQVMPEHVHIVLFVHRMLPVPFGQLIRGLKAGARKRWLVLSSEKMDACQSAAGGDGPRWARGFQDTVLLHEHQLNKMLAYVRDNPRRLAEKRLHPEYFRTIRQLTLPLSCGQRMGVFSALGNVNLLKQPLYQVQCSRKHFVYHRVLKRGGGFKIERDAKGEPLVAQETSAYKSLLSQTLTAAAQGRVILSPCISDGERQIAREVLARGWRLVVLRNKGFPPQGAKPSGRAFDACVAGQFLQIAPIAWPYTENEKPMTRIDAVILNRLAQWLAGEDAIEINYHGWQPEEIDARTMEAVTLKA